MQVYHAFWIANLQSGRNTFPCHPVRITMLVAGSHQDLASTMDAATCVAESHGHGVNHR